MMRWRYEIDEKGYILGWEGANVANIVEEEQSFPPLPNEINYLGLRDVYGNLRYKLVPLENPDGDIKYEIIEVPQKPTDDQIRILSEREKKERITTGINMDHNDEIALLNKAIEALINGESVPVEYIEYRKRVSALKEVPNG